MNVKDRLGSYLRVWNRDHEPSCGSLGKLIRDANALCLNFPLTSRSPRAAAFAHLAHPAPPLPATLSARATGPAAASMTAAEFSAWSTRPVGVSFVPAKS